jgi:class 3 adenylate cyclase/tetratricopeptide (TPR) repeat protein
MKTCGDCGEENPERARFCLRCGSELVPVAAAAREERKVVTVLFADLVGFTGRAERLDPEEVRAVLQPYHARLRAELERFGGTVEKFIGDAVMAVFGAPVAHEDDPERAVRAALAIREALEADGELHVRIGITTGEALVSLGARPEEGEGMAAGDVVNTAARLQGGAPVDGILVDETTFRATERAIVYRESAPVVAKGKEAPVPVWKAVETRSRFGVDWAHRGRAPLVGRGRELDVLADALARARSGRSVQLVTIVGVPGMGKSRLVWELSRLVEVDPELVYWRQGRSLPYGDGITFWALGEMVKAHAGVLDTDAAEVAGEKLARTVADAIPDEEDRPWVESHLRALVGLAGGEQQGNLDESFAAWRRFFEALADRSPLVLVFEDLHWADESLLDFVDHLSDWATGVPLLIVCSARPELLVDRPAWGGGKTNAVTLSLAPLSDEDTARLVGALLERSVLPAETQAALLARAGGNPLYAEEYTRMVAERGPGGTLELPETLQGIIAARLDTLTTEEKELLQDAAVVGKVFWLGALTTISRRERARAEELLHGLERREFVNRQRHSSFAAESEYAFRHILVRDVAYGQIPRAARADKHRAAAEWIESLGRPEDNAETVAHHYLTALELMKAAGRPRDDVAEATRRALREAGNRALGLEAARPAAAFFGSALELWPEGDPERAHLLLRLGIAKANASAGGREELEAARDLLLAAGDRVAAAEAEARLGGVFWSELDRDRAFVHMERATALVADAPPSPAKASVYAQSARMLTLAEEREQALELGRQALEMAESLGLERLRVTILSSSVGMLRVGRGDPGGLADLELAVELAEELRSPEVVRAQMNLASMLVDSGELTRAFGVYEAGRRNAARFGEVYRGRWLEAEQALEFFWTGRWEQALKRVEDFLAADAEAGSPHYMAAVCHEVRARVRVARGDLAGADDDTQRAVALARQIKDPQALYPGLASRARALFELSRDGEARALANELSTLLEERPFAPTYWVVDLALVREGLGQPEPLLPAPPVLRLPWLAAAEAYAAGEFAYAAEILGGIGSQPDAAYARLRAGEALAAAGRHSEADLELRRALDFYRSVGASRYVRRAEGLLAASA